VEFSILEEGLYQEKQNKKIEYKTNCCLRCIPYLRLIFLLEITLFFGWGCYMVLQIYLSQAKEYEATSFNFERYPSMIDSLSEVQKSRPSTEMPAIFVKPEVIINKISNLLENMKLAKDQNLMQNEAIVTSMVQTNTQNSNNIRKINDFDTLLERLSFENLMHNKKFMKNSVPEKFSSIESIENVNPYNKEKSSLHTQFLKKLQNISKVEAASDLERFKSRNDFTEEVDRLSLKSQENHALDTVNKLENLEFNAATISNLKNFVDHAISVDLTDILQNRKQNFFEFKIKDAAQDDRSKDNSLSDEINKPVNARLELDFVICPPYESHESSDMSMKDLAKDSFISQPVLAQEISEQIENGSSDDIDERNEDEKHINDNDMSMLAFASGNQDYFDTAVAMQNTEEQHSSESVAKITEDEKYESMENFYKLFLQPTVQESVESSTPNVDQFQWFNMPPRFADLEWEDTSKSSEIRSLLRDMRENVNVDDVIPESQCEVTLKMGVLKVKCPTINIDEEWNFIFSKIPSTDIPKVFNFRDVFDIFLHVKCDKDASEQSGIENISNENSDKEVTTSWNIVPKTINTIELQESTTSAKISNDALMDLSDAASIDPFGSENISEIYDFPFYDSNEEEVKQVTTSSISEVDSSLDSNKGQNSFIDIPGTQQHEQLKISQQDSLVSDNTESNLKDFEQSSFYDLKMKLTSLLTNELFDITMQDPENSYENNYRHNICSILRYMRSISQYPWREQYVALRKFLEHLRNLDYPHSTDDYYH